MGEPNFFDGDLSGFRKIDLSYISNAVSNRRSFNRKPRRHRGHTPLMVRLGFLYGDI